MKKLLLCLVAVLCFSCTNYEKKLMGKWKYYVYFGDTEYDGEKIVEFKEDSTLITYSSEHDGSPFIHEWFLEDRNDSLVLHIDYGIVIGKDLYVRFHGDTLITDYIFDGVVDKHFTSKLYKIE
ncbi:MAG: hypothetical protein IKP52_02185 [Prevotella sp.]|nr:hypothetical protein [Prevotella sp.]